MADQEIMKVLAEVGAVIIDSHIVYTSGRHGSTYVNKDALYKHTQKTSQLCEMMANQYDPQQIDVVIGPTIGGVVLSQWLAHHLNARRTSGETLSLYAEKVGQGAEKRFVIERGYDLFIPEKIIVVVEDILTTGGSANQVIECVRALGGNIIGLSVLCNRGDIKPATVGNVPIHALTSLMMTSWEEKECPLCKDSVPINTNVGKGKEFLEKHNPDLLKTTLPTSKKQNRTYK